MISVTGLRKSYGSTLVLDGVDLEVAEGTIFALLGPNGAGKTTMVNILSTLIGADGGSARVAGHDVARSRTRCATRSASPASSRRSTTCSRARRTCGSWPISTTSAPPRPASGSPRCSSASTSSTPPDRPASTYSGGMRRRLDLAMTLVGDPRVIFLDEPTTGLDPRSRRTMWETIRGLVAGGVTVFLTTQYLEEADELADRIALLDRGRDRGRGHLERAQAPRARRARAAAVRGARESGRGASALRARSPTTRRADESGARAARDPPARDPAGRPSVQPGLDDVFLSLTQESR